MIATLPPTTIAVCDTCAIRSLGDALRSAKDGATIVVRGRQHGNFVVSVPVTIAGAGDAVLDGGGTGTVVTINAPYVTIRDLSVIGSGSDFVSMDAAIRSNSAHTSIRNVRVADTLFGIYLAHSDGSVLDRVHVLGRAFLPVPERGDGFRIWYSADVRVSDSDFQNVRDDLVWFSRSVTLSGNTVANGRYGFHSMYSNDMRLVSNVVRNCEVGSYFMYGKRLHVSKNVFLNNRGSTGYGIGLKDIDDSKVDDNAFVSNHVGIYVDDSPSLEGSTVRFTGNLLAYNSMGFAGLPSSRGDVVLANAFVQNYQQVAVLGGGTLTGVTWSRGAHGNYWSDYAGFDRNGDGVGDVAYREQSVYGSLSDLDSRLDLLAYGPAARAIDFASNALPLFSAPVSAVDASPQMKPYYPSGLPRIGQPGSSAPYGWAGVAALTLSLAVLVPLRPRKRRTARSRRGADSAGAVVVARELRKRYGRTLALDGVDLDVEAGETVALWGPNGSGKTTLLRCIIGLVAHEGAVCIRGEFAYVPQQLPLFDMRVGEMCDFVGSLRGVSHADCETALRDAELADLRERSVAELSGGQRQRLSVALASLGDPSVLLLDEPTVGLDLRSRNEILRRLKLLKAAGKTIVIASHIPEDIVEIADRVIVMEEGRVLRVATCAEFEAIVERRRAVS